MANSPDEFDSTVIISTYNSPTSLEKTLWGYQSQSITDFEIIIADDGSTCETRDVVEDYQKQGMSIVHLWQEDCGFRKNRILNQAILASRSPYCIFTDGDCIPRSDFVESHRRLRRKNRYLAAGSHVSLSRDFHVQLTRDDIQSGNVFRDRWLIARGHRKTKNLLRLSVAPAIRPILNLATHRSRVFTGNGSSVWRADALAVNGFDSRFGYGGGDKDFGLRLSAFGVKSRMCKFSVVSLHLDHSQPYMDAVAVAKNKQHLRQIRANGTIWTEYGIVNRNDETVPMRGTSFKNRPMVEPPRQSA